MLVYISIFLFLLMSYEAEAKCQSKMSPYNDEVECTRLELDEIYEYLYDNIDNTYNKELRSLSIENSTDLQNIEAFPDSLKRLETLKISHSGLRRLNVQTLLPNVRCLYLSHNNIEDFNDLKLDQLDLNELDLSYNKMKNISIVGTPFWRIYKLDLSHNLLEDFGNLFSLDRFGLYELDLSYNRLRNISVPDIGYVSSLQVLKLGHNQISMIDSKILTIRNIDFSANNFTNLQLSTLSSFDEVNLSGNNLKTINFTNIQIASFILSNNNFTELNPLNFVDAKIDSLDLSNNNLRNLSDNTFLSSIGIVELDLSRNFLCHLSPSYFTGLKSLKRLSLSHNSIETIKAGTFNETASLTSLDLSHNSIQVLPPRIFEKLHLAHLNLSRNKLKTVPGSAFRSSTIAQLNLAHNEILGFSENSFVDSAIYEILLDGAIFYEIERRDFLGLRHVRTLNLTNVGMKKIHADSFDAIEKLERLILDHNHIESVPARFLSGSSNIQSLSLVGNEIAHLKNAFSLKSRMKTLNISIQNELTKKMFVNLLNLVELNVIDSVIPRIQKGSFRGLSSLKKISLSNTKVSIVEIGAFLGLINVLEFDTQNLFGEMKTLLRGHFHGLKRLRTLNLSRTGLSWIGGRAFEGLDSLETLDLSWNNVSDLSGDSLVGLTSLKSLNLAHNELTGKQSTFPIGIFRHLNNLERLQLEHNAIYKFHIGEFSNLRQLQFLNLSHNQLSYLDRHLLFPLKNLNTLDINSNNVIKFDYQFILEHLTELRTVGIGANKWKCENLTLMLEHLQKKLVDYLAISKLELETENIDGISCVYPCNYLFCPTEEDLNVTY